MYKLYKKLTVARQDGFMFNQINKLPIKLFSHLRYKNKSYYLNSHLPMCHREFFRVISQNLEYVENFCNNMENPFQFACQKWINQLN